MRRKTVYTAAGYASIVVVVVVVIDYAVDLSANRP